jgi:C4-dicarboxylate-binding protein DctP
MVLVLVAGGCGPKEPEKFTIKMNTALDPPWREDMGKNPLAWTLEWFCATVNERTQGQVEFEIYWLSELGVQGTEDLRAVRDGLLDVTASPDGYIAGDIPELMIANQLLLMDASEYQLIAPKIEPILDKTLTEKWGVVPIAYWPGEEQILNSIKPMDSVDDFAGIKLRGWAPSHVELANSLGASPVSITMAELYVAYQRGIADAIITSLGTYINLKLYEVGKYFNTIPLNSALIFVYFNEDAFNSLPENIQEIIFEVAEESSQFHLGTAMPGYYEIYDRAIPDFGMINVDFPPEELEKIRAIAPAIWEEWASSNGPTAQELLRLARETLGR